MRMLISISFIIFLLAGACFLSYSSSKKVAQEVADSFPGELSPLKANIVLFGSSDLTPCWVFTAEYEDQLTGATFDVYVSLLGKPLKIPPKTKMP
jgi:hypothetical protein